MRKETDYQSWVVDTVREHGGAATKLSNRFLVGVSDLLIKLPDHSALLLEVKLNKFQSDWQQRMFKLHVTRLQQNFLVKFAQAGFACGVLSIVEIGGRGVRGISFGLFNLDALDKAGYYVCLGDHFKPIISTKARADLLISSIEDFLT